MGSILIISSMSSSVLIANSNITIYFASAIMSGLSIKINFSKKENIQASNKIESITDKILSRGFLQRRFDRR